MGGNATISSVLTEMERRMNGFQVLQAGDMKQYINIYIYYRNCHVSCMYNGTIPKAVDTGRVRDFSGTSVSSPRQHASAPAPSLVKPSILLAARRYPGRNLG